MIITICLMILLKNCTGRWHLSHSQGMAVISWRNILFKEDWSLSINKLKYLRRVTFGQCLTVHIGCGGECTIWVHVYCMYSSKTWLENCLINWVKLSRCNLTSQTKKFLLQHHLSMMMSSYKQFSIAASKCTRTCTRVRISIPLKKNNRTCCLCWSSKELTPWHLSKNINYVLYMHTIELVLLYRHSTGNCG